MTLIDAEHTVVPFRYLPDAVTRALGQQFTQSNVHVEECYVADIPKYYEGSDYNIPTQRALIVNFIGQVSGVSCMKEGNVKAAMANQACFYDDHRNGLAEDHITELGLQAPVSKHWTEHVHLQDVYRS